MTFGFDEIEAKSAATVEPEMPYGTGQPETQDATEHGVNAGRELVLDMMMRVSVEHGSWAIDEARVNE